VSGSSYTNWFDWPDDVSTAKAKGVVVKDDTPFEVKSHPEYKKLTERFLGGLFKDKNLEKHNKGNKAADIDHDEINEEKEREGYYPNELD